MIVDDEAAALDSVLLDIRVPGMDDHALSRESGFDRHRVKPVRLSELAEILERGLRMFFKSII